MQTPTPSTLETQQILQWVQGALVDQDITANTRALCALDDEGQLLCALQSAALLDALWDGLLVQSPDVSTVFWAQICARLDEQRKATSLLPYIDTRSSLFSLAVHPMCAQVLESAFVHLAAVLAQTLQEHGSEALQEELLQVDENVLHMRTLLGEQFEQLLAPAYEALVELEQHELEALPTCAQVLYEMLDAALNVEETV